MRKQLNYPVINLDLVICLSQVCMGVYVISDTQSWNDVGVARVGRERFTLRKSFNSIFSPLDSSTKHMPKNDFNSYKEVVIMERCNLWA